MNYYMYNFLNPNTTNNEIFCFVEEAIRPGNFKCDKYGAMSATGRSSSGGSQLDPEDEISRNQEFYRTQDVRPPFTYAALIRQVIGSLKQNETNII